jgi:hypothetical protein
MLQLFWLLYTLMARIIFALFTSLSKLRLVRQRYFTEEMKNMVAFETQKWIQVVNNAKIPKQ